MNRRKPRREAPVAENNPRINCQSTQLQVTGKVLFKTVQEKAVREIYNLFSWTYISLYSWQAVMENRLPARSYSPDCCFSNLLSASVCSFNIQSILWCWLVQWPRHAWGSLRILTTVLFPFFFFTLLIFLESNYFTILYWFCHTLTWIRHGCICVPHPELPSHLPPLPIPRCHPGQQEAVTERDCCLFPWQSYSPKRKTRK